MFTDARTLEEDVTVACDVCIVGAGAAGITIAREFIGRPYTVCVLESGGLEYDAETQALCAGESVGQRYNPLLVSRLRYFGGTTNHWTGLCSPLDPIDFEVRSWVPHSGWPITRAELDPYYARAQHLCELGPYRYDDLAFWEDAAHARLPLDERRITTKIFQQSPPTRFGQVYRADLEQAKNVDVLLHANALGVDTNAYASETTRLRAGCLNGTRFSVRARHYVLACGGIENARLLLLSNEVEPGGLGNRHDRVGRFFMDHPHVNAGRLVLSDPATPLALYAFSTHRGARVGGFLRPSEALQREHHLLNCTAALVPLAERGYLAMRRVYHRLRLGDASSASLMQDLKNVIADFDDVIVGLNDALLGKEQQGPTAPDMGAGAFWLEARVEPAPNPESRLTLSRERDALGLPRIRLDWRLSTLDKRTVRTTNQLIGHEVGRAALGRVQVLDWLTDDDDTWPASMYGGNHHIGTTRMSHTPREGVVDARCRVHGVSNLYVAGSSVFPTAGCANPTLTIVALAVRLAQHLDRELAG